MTTTITARGVTQHIDSDGSSVAAPVPVRNSPLTPRMQRVLNLLTVYACRACHADPCECVRQRLVHRLENRVAEYNMAEDKVVTPVQTRER
jgi:hypothetical protein